MLDLRPLLALSLLAPLACRPPATAPPAACTGAITDLAWLTGTWRARDGADLTEEQWTTATAGAMFGLGRSVTGDRTEFFEYLRVEARQGGLVFIAQPRGGPPVEFPQATCSPGDLTFANAAHDFPKQVRYRLQPDGTLATTVSAGERSQHLVLTRSDR